MSRIEIQNDDAIFTNDAGNEQLFRRYLDESHKVGFVVDVIVEDYADAQREHKSIHQFHCDTLAEALQDRDRIKCMTPAQLAEEFKYCGWGQCSLEYVYVYEYAADGKKYNWERQ